MQTTTGLKYKVAKVQDHANTAEIHVSCCYTPVPYATTQLAGITDWRSHVWHDANRNVQQFDSNHQQPLTNKGSDSTNIQDNKHTRKPVANEVCLKEAALTCFQGSVVVVYRA